MKKYVQNFWVRVLVCILCSVTLVSGLVAGTLITGIAALGSKEYAYENGLDDIAEHYAAYIYDHIDDYFNTKEKLDEFLLDKNFTCSITKVTQNEDAEGVAQNEMVVLYEGSASESSQNYEIEIVEGSFVNYNMESVLDALRTASVIEEQMYTVDAAIVGYVFDPEIGLFYYHAGSQYFLADYIKVSHDGAYYDYQIRNAKDGKKVYYNSYYDLTLDTSKYSEWDWVELNNIKLNINEMGDGMGKEIDVISDESIQEYLYTGIYYENAGENLISFYPERTEDIYIINIVVEDLTHVEHIYDDMFYEWRSLCDTIYGNKQAYQMVLILSIVLFILSVALMIYSAKKEKEELGFWNKLPVGCFSVVLIGIDILCAGLFFVCWNDLLYQYRVMPTDIYVMLLLLILFAIAFIAMIWLQNIITRFKTGTFLRYSEIFYAYKMIKWCWAKVTLPFKMIGNMLREHTTLFMRGLVIMLVIGFVEFFVIVACRWDYDLYLFIFFLAKIVEIPLVIFILLQMQNLQEGSKRIAAGDLSQPIDTSKMIWEFKKHGENINKVSDGIALAVEERMKSEHFKTELITNVSHDIKTPLTSIINYVDLIKKEKIQDETLLEYVEVLDRQSARLKKLIEDLMEASKASTGNLAVNMEDCDIEVLLTQLIGEFEEKLNANQLEIVVQKPEHPVIISADGRHMWRVLDNLLNNACKYSLPGSRVYISLVQNGNEATITFKNISKAALNIPSDELMERFVRGDSSRNTEGSGLGLSIAQSLTELMKGTMKLEIDGDLFKVTLRFQAKSK